MKIMVGCNLLTSLNSIVYPNHTQMWYYLGRETDHEYLLNSPRRLSIDNMRNQCAQTAILNECDYLFFYDDDVLLPKDSLPRMIKVAQEEKASIVAGLVYVRGYPFKSMAFHIDEETKGLDHIPDEVIEDSESNLIECKAIGFSCALLDVKILKEMEPPWFLTGIGSTEDVYFCLKTTAIIPDTKILLDKSIQCEHLIDHYAISHENHKLIQEFEENVFEAKSQTSDFPAEAIERARERLGRGVGADS